MTNFDINNNNEENIKIIPLIKKKDKIYIDPPLVSDGISIFHNRTRMNRQHVTVTDLNSASHTGGILHKVGCAIYLAKTGIKKDNVYLSNLPKGYHLKRGSNRIFYIGGHPSGHKFYPDTFLPHFLWLEDCWQSKDLPRMNRSNCTCHLCTFPNFIPSLSFQMESCTPETFKIFTNIEIACPPSDEIFYPKQFIIPIPTINEAAAAANLSLLLSSEQE